MIYLADERLWVGIAIPKPIVDKIDVDAMYDITDNAEEFESKYRDEGLEDNLGPIVITEFPEFQILTNEKEILPFEMIFEFVIPAKTG